MTDREIKNRIMESKQDGYRCLLQEYGGYVYSIVSGVLKNTGSSEDIEECVSDVFIKLVMDTEYLENERSALKSFIGTAARNRAVDFYRKLTGRARYYSDEEITDLTDHFSHSITPEKMLADKEFRNYIWNSVEKLGEPDSSIITGQYMFGKSVSEIAASLSMNVMTVYKRSMRARKKLQRILDEYVNGKKEKGVDLYETSTN